MLATRRVAALATTAAIAVGACSSGSSPVVKLDGSPRTPDVEGVVLKASVNGITLDGNRHYDVSKKLISFSTYNREVVPLASTIGAYVQAGVRDKTIVWISKIGPVGASHTVQYQGDLVAAKGRTLTFKDGTVLTLAAGLKAPADPEGPTYAVIDANKHVVQGATFAPPRTKN
jgi:hypothetical protein